MRAEDRALLKSTPLFANLSAGSIDRLTYNAFVQNLPAGAVLFQQGDQPEFLYILLSGRVALTGRNAEGDEAVIEFFRRGDDKPQCPQRAQWIQRLQRRHEFRHDHRRGIGDGNRRGRKSA